MAQAAVTYDSVMSELKTRHFHPVYYLMGDEPYYIDLIPLVTEFHSLCSSKYAFRFYKYD